MGPCEEAAQIHAALLAAGGRCGIAASPAQVLRVPPDRSAHPGPRPGWELHPSRKPGSVALSQAGHCGRGGRFQNRSGAGISFLFAVATNYLSFGGFAPALQFDSGLLSENPGVGRAPCCPEDPGGTRPLASPAPEARQSLRSLVCFTLAPAVTSPH